MIVPARAKPALCALLFAAALCVSLAPPAMAKSFTEQFSDSLDGKFDVSPKLKRAGILLLAGHLLDSRVSARPLRSLNPFLTETAPGLDTELVVLFLLEFGKPLRSVRTVTGNAGFTHGGKVLDRRAEIACRCRHR